MRFKRHGEPPRDLHTQLEDLLHQVWDSERRERMNDRLAALEAAEKRRSKRTRKGEGNG